MKDYITLKVPNEYEYFKVFKQTLRTISKQINFDKKDLKELIKASHEIFDNAIKHAYLGSDGFIEIDFHLLKCGIRIDIRDWGIPISKDTPKEIISTRKSGFSRVDNLVNNFRYYNLGKEGKKFSLIKYKLKCTLEESDKSKKTKIRTPDNSNKKIIVRNFQKGDEEGISRLIYENYGHSYIKELFYYPSEILSHENKKYHSIVALDEELNELVGHFALIVADDSNIAEIGIVVVRPDYKGLGIMNKMFDLLISHAKKLKLDAIYGEAIMYHSFSQKSNATHKFFETALEYGKFPADIQIENNKTSKLQKRGSVLICYKLLKYQNKTIYLPKLYAKKVKEVYDKCSQIKYKVETKKDKINKKTKIKNIFNPVLNVSTIICDGYSKGFNQEFKQIFNQLQNKHCELIFAHINLEDIGFNIDKIIKYLHKLGFFYSGVLPLYHNNKDYLQLQFHNTEDITDKNIECYSGYCKKLFKFIKKDKAKYSIL